MLVGIKYCRNEAEQSHKSLVLPVRNDFPKGIPCELGFERRLKRIKQPRRQQRILSNQEAQHV